MATKRAHVSTCVPNVEIQDWSCILLPCEVYAIVEDAALKRTITSSGYFPNTSLKYP